VGNQGGLRAAGLLAFELSPPRVPGDGHRGGAVGGPRQDTGLSRSCGAAALALATPIAVAAIGVWLLARAR
jgi:hypothetical protein